MDNFSEKSSEFSQESGNWRTILYDQNKLLRRMAEMESQLDKQIKNLESQLKDF